MPILHECERKNGADADLRASVEKIVDIVVPRLLGALEDLRPVCVHGDLWGGNSSIARIGSRKTVEAVVFDPSVCSELLALSRLTVMVTDNYPIILGSRATRIVSTS
jgi:fructosamine-3-kinase